jgi:hypothetical protein
VIDKICNKIAWWLPKRIVYHAFVRMASYATVGKYGGQIVSELTVFEAMERWNSDSNRVKAN